jgi:hypothetical protein
MISKYLISFCSLTSFVNDTKVFFLGCRLLQSCRICCCPSLAYLQVSSSILSKRDTLRNLNFKILSMQDMTSSWPKRLRETKFQLSRSYDLGCSRGTNVCQQRRWRRCLTTGKNILVFSQFMTFYR